MHIITNIKKISVRLLYVLLFLLPVISHAGPGDGDPTGGIKNPLRVATLSGFIGAIVEIARDIGFFVAIFFIIYSGFLFVKARGNEQEITKAKSALTWTLVGTAVLLGAWIFATAIQGTINNL